jgi:membrane protease YdiL (CAAX protease family)
VAVDQPDLTGAPYPGAPVTYAEALRDGAVLRRPRWGLADIAIAMLLAVIVPVIVLSVMAALGAGPGTSAFFVASFVSPWVGFGLWPWLTTRLQGNGPRIDLGLSLRWSDLGWGLLGGAACIVLGTVVAALTTLIFGEFGSAAGEALLDPGIPKALVAVVIVLIVTVGPLCEELCFRGLAFASVARFSAAHGWAAVPVATVVSALLFTLIHFEPVRIGVLLTIGLVLGLLRARTGRLGASVVAHGVNNAVAVIELVRLLLA